MLFEKICQKTNRFNKKHSSCVPDSTNDFIPIFFNWIHWNIFKFIDKGDAFIDEKVEFANSCFTKLCFFVNSHINCVVISRTVVVLCSCSFFCVTEECNTDNLHNIFRKCLQGEFCNRPYSRYWTGTSVQLRLMRGVFSNLFKYLRN